MSVVKNKTTQENREFWSHVETVARDVANWPQWGERGPVDNSETITIERRSTVSDENRNAVSCKTE